MRILIALLLTSLSLSAATLRDGIAATTIDGVTSAATVDGVTISGGGGGTGSSLNTNLIAYWKFEESSGTAVDSYGTNDLTEMSGPVSSTTGKIGNGRQFVSSSTDYLKIDTHPLTGATTWTMAAWVNLTTAESFPMVFSSTHSPTAYLDLRYSSNTRRPQFAARTASDDKSITSASALATGTWNLIVGLYNGTNLILYANGTQVGTTASTTPVIPADLWMGARSDGNYLNGIVDEAAIWDRALTASEITELYNSGTGVDYPF